MHNNNSRFGCHNRHLNWWCLGQTSMIRHCCCLYCYDRRMPQTEPSISAAMADRGHAAVAPRGTELDHIPCPCFRGQQAGTSAQVMVPGKPALSLTSVWGLPFQPLSDSAPDTPFVRTLKAFITGDDAERSTIFKLIPRCTNCSLPSRTLSLLLRRSDATLMQHDCDRVHLQTPKELWP